MSRPSHPIWVTLPADRRGSVPVGLRLAQARLSTRSDRVGDAVAVVFGHHSDQLLEHFVRNGETGVSVWWHHSQVTVKSDKFTVYYRPQPPLNLGSSASAASVLIC